MPRMLRLESPGSLVHVMARGIDGTDIYRDDQDRLEFLSRVAVNLQSTQYQCLCWCLMNNHYHLLLRMNDAPLSKLMRPLNSGYARWFNTKYKRRGYLFQDRFKSILCQDQEYAKQLIRYVHLNPIRGSMVTSLDELKYWKWCGHGFLLGVKGALGKGFQERRETLRRFGTDEHRAIVNYLQFMSDGISSEKQNLAGLPDDAGSIEISGSFKGWPAVIGDPEFAQTAMARHQELKKLRIHRKADYPYILKNIAAAVCKEFSIAYDDLFLRGRKSPRSAARSHFCYRAYCNELIPFCAIARFLNITIPSATALWRAGKDAATKR